MLGVVIPADLNYCGLLEPTNCDTSINCALEVQIYGAAIAGAARGVLVLSYFLGHPSRFRLADTGHFDPFCVFYHVLCIHEVEVNRTQENLSR